MLAKDSLTGQGLSDTELYDQVITLMLAGHEVNLSYCFSIKVKDINQFNQMEMKESC